MARRDTLETGLRLHAHQIHERIKEVPNGEVKAEYGSSDLVVRIQVVPVNTLETQPCERFPGRYFSPLERLIWNAVNSVNPIVAKEIAAAIGEAHDTKLKYLLLNLEDRGVLLHEVGKGYTRAKLVNTEEN